MFERFTKEAKTIVAQAEVEARQLGARKIEAEHLLLALARAGAVGLDHDALLEALEAEMRASLQGVGVTLADYEPLPVHAGVGRVRFGTSAKAALERTLKAAMERGEKQLDGRALARGVLLAHRGTVPRALERADISVSKLLREL